MERWVVVDEAYFDTQRPAMVKLSMSTETGVSGFRTHRHQRCVVLEANGLVMERNKRGGDKFHPPGIFNFCPNWFSPPTMKRFHIRKK